MNTEKNILKHEMRNEIPNRASKSSNDGTLKELSWPSDGGTVGSAGSSNILSGSPILLLFSNIGATPMSLEIGCNDSMDGLKADTPPEDKAEREEGSEPAGGTEMGAEFGIVPKKGAGDIFASSSCFFIDKSSISCLISASDFW